MHARRTALVLSLPLAFAACTQVDREAPRNEIVKAVFDPTQAIIPLPNDLALQNPPPAGTGTGDLLRLFIEGGGWPNDQEVPIDVPLARLTRQANGTYAADTAPVIDAATVNASTVALLRIDGASLEAVPFDVDLSTPGVLRLRKQAAADGSRHWAEGARYVVALRAGPSGVRTTSGTPLSADQITSFITQGKSLLVPEFQPPGLPPALAPQLETLRLLYATPLDWTSTGASWIPVATDSLPAAFAAVETVFPAKEIASVLTFETEAGTHVAADPAAGQIPLPSDFLLDVSNPADVHVQYLPSAFGPAAAGLATLDGFSTTGMLLAATTGPVESATVSRSSVLLFKSDGTWLHDVASNPALAAYLSQPPALGAPYAPAIGLQPAVPVPISATQTVFLPPLEEGTTYVVLVTDGVHDAQGRPLRRGTLGKFLLSYDGDLATLPGLDPATAAGLTAIRAGLAPLLDNLGTFTGGAVTKDHVVMAYPVTTQSVTDTSVLLSAVPYDPNGDHDFSDSAAFVASAPTLIDTQAAFGIPAAAFPNVGAFYSTSIASLDAIDKATGALQPNPALWAPATIPAFLAVPASTASLPFCDGAAPPRCAPLVIFHHGLGRSRLDLLGVADALAARGFVVAAIDAPLHGDRAWCASAADCDDGAGGPGTCTPIPGSATQGDAIPPGTCTSGSALRRDATRLNTVASGNYFVSANFFRTRDAIRHDLLDHAALVLELARPPAAAGFPQPADDLRQTLATDHGIAIDPTKVYLEGVSLGGIIGTQIVAASPRFARAVLNVAGGTIVDVFTNAPAFADEVDALFLSLGIDRSDPADASRYLQTLVVAKWILDPADPINYARYVGPAPARKLVSPLDGLEALSVAHTGTAAIGQLAHCDDVVPNAFNLLLFTNAGIASTTYGTTAVCPDPGVSHGFLATSTTAQGHAAAFLDLLTAPPATSAP